MSCVTLCVSVHQPRELSSKYVRLQECADSPEVYDALQRLHSMAVLDIIDEVDIFLSCKTQLIYAHGDPQPLPALDERSCVASELLHAFAACPEVQQLLPQVAVETQHERRWGGARDLRLMKGAHPPSSSREFHLRFPAARHSLQHVVCLLCRCSIGSQWLFPGALSGRLSLHGSLRPEDIACKVSPHC